MSSKSLLSLLVKDTNNLLIQSDAVVNFGSLLNDIVSGMIEIVRTTGSDGLSACQIGINKRILVVAGVKELRGETIAMINPLITWMHPEFESTVETCLSFPKEKICLPRSISITVEYQNTNGEICHESYNGDMAKRVQHEMDHLEGMAMVKRTLLVTQEPLQKKQSKMVVGL